MSKLFLFIGAGIILLIIALVIIVTRQENKAPKFKYKSRWQRHHDEYDNKD